MNSYRLLGIQPGASKRDIIDAFRKKAKEFHPDLNPDDPEADKKFKEINDAYQTLLAGGVSALVPEGGQDSFYSHPPRRVNSIKEITLTIQEAMNGVHYCIDDADGRCDTCNGEGSVRLKHAISCQYCGGSGKSAHKDKGTLYIDVVCSHCAGSGKTMRRKCLECHGFGIKAGAGLVIDLPPGCLPGDSFIVENGYSNPTRNIIGDLEIIIGIKQDPRFRVSGNNVEMELALEVWEAVLGTKKAVTGPDGTRFGVEVPARTTHGRRIRLKGLGMRKNTVDQDKGDLILVTTIRIPDVGDDKIKEAYERLRDEVVTN